MEVKHSTYSHSDSISRIDEILNGSDASYEDKKSIPSRDSLTFSNGFNVECSAVCIDIRDSKSLSEKHTKPVQTKIYKTYISELVAVLKDHSGVNELYIEGDGVWGIFNTPYLQDINELFSVAAKAASLVDTLNVKYKKKNYTELKVGIGISYGSSLLIKSGYKGSGINEVVWLGKLVGEASQLCFYGNRTYNDSRLMVSSGFHQNLSEYNQKLLSYNANRGCYHGGVIDVAMDEWVQKKRRV
jgi:class 3 adenylate cyclase